MRERDVEALLMGGQACVPYGAAEFSRDADFAVLASSENLERLRGALDDLEAEVIAVPPFRSHYLERGHAIHRLAAAGRATGDYEPGTEPADARPGAGAGPQANITRTFTGGC